MAKLYINEGGKEAVFELFDDSPEVTVGRGASNAVQIADGHASKVHFVVRRIRGRWKVIDLESKNGTRVNGGYQNAHWLTHNDTLTVGSVVLRFDAEGEPSGAPPRAAVPVVATPARAGAPAAAGARAAVPVAAAPVAAVPVARAAPVAPARAAVAMAAPAAARSAAAHQAAPAAREAPAPVRAAPRRSRDEPYDEEDGEERPRFAPRKTGLSGGVLALLILVGVGVVVLLLGALMDSGENANSAIRDTVRKLRSKGDRASLEQALAELQKGQQGEAGWSEILKETVEIQGLLATEKTKQRWKEADAWRHEHLRLIATGGTGAGAWNPKDSPPPKEAAHRLREFIRIYGDTSIAREIVSGTGANNEAYQRILRENQDPARTDRVAFDEAEARISDDVNAGRLGLAYDLLSFALRVERLNLAAAAYTPFEARVQERQGRLKSQAIEVLDKALNDGASLHRRGETKMGKAAVEATLKILAWPDSDLKRRADDAMRAW